MEKQPIYDEESIQMCKDLAIIEAEIESINKQMSDKPELSYEETSTLNLRLNILLERSSNLEERLKTKGLTHHDALEMGQAEITADNNFKNNHDMRASA